MPMHDYRCTDCGHVFDELVSYKDTELPCVKCGNVAQRVYLTTPKLDYLGMGAQQNVSPEFQDRFDKMHRERKEKEEKCEREHGDYGPAAGA